MLKRLTICAMEITNKPAAFRRLCVETCFRSERVNKLVPAAFRRLCVETIMFTTLPKRSKTQPPSGGCVLKLQHGKLHHNRLSSRLQAAVC